MSKGLGKGRLTRFFLENQLIKWKVVEKISVKIIKVNPFQPRKIFDEAALGELSESIKEHGVLQPIILRKKGKSFEIVVGESRFRASKAAGLK